MAEAEMAGRSPQKRPPTQAFHPAGAPANPPQTQLLLPAPKTSPRPRCLALLQGLQRAREELWLRGGSSYCCSLVKSCPTLWPHGLQHARLPCPSLSPGLLKFRSAESAMPSSHLILLPPFPFASNLSQNQGLFQWVGSSHQVAKVLELQHQSLQWIFRTDFL